MAIRSVVLPSPHRSSIATMLLPALAVLWLQGVRADSQVGVQPTKKLPADFKMCGCIWSEGEGCAVSSRQIFKALTSATAADKCQEGQEWSVTPEEAKRIQDPAAATERVKNECKIRNKLRTLAPTLEKCLDLDATSCSEQAEEGGCEWGAQVPDTCGIDKEKLIKKIVGEEGEKRPLMTIVLKADMCQDLSKTNCDTDDDCTFDKVTGKCQIGEKFVWANILEQPEIMNMLFIINDGSMCRAMAEHGNLECQPNYCQSEGGFCSVDPRVGPKRDEGEKLLNKLCDRHYKNTSNCDSPCSMQNRDFELDDDSLRNDKKEDSKAEDRQICLGHVEHSSRDNGLKTQNIEVAQAYMIVHSALVPFERHCNMMDGNKIACLKCAANQTCDGPLGDKWSLHGGGETAEEDPAPGLSGYLGEVASAVQSFAIDRLFDDFLDSHPHAIKDLLKSYKDISRIYDGSGDGDIGGSSRGDKGGGEKVRQAETPPDFFRDPWASDKNPTHVLLMISGLLLVGAVFGSFKYGLPRTCVPHNPAADALVDDSGSDIEG